MRFGFRFFGVAAVISATVAGAIAADTPYFRAGRVSEPVENPALLQIDAPGALFTRRINAEAAIPAPVVRNNAGPFTWSVESGPLPAGTNLGPAGDITGRPTTPGFFGGIRVRGYTRDGKSGVSGAYAVSVIGMPSIGYVNLTTSVTQTVRLGPNLTNIAGPATYLLSGTLPAGVTHANGVLTGKPTAPGVYDNLRVTVTDFDNVQATSQPFRLTIVEAAVDVAVLDGAGRVDLPFNLPIAAAGLTGPVTWSLDAGRLPEGIEIDQNGALAGTPRVAGASSGLILKGVDANGLTAWSNAFSITIGEASISYRSASASLGTPYSLAPEAVGIQSGARWMLSRGSLPTGLHLSDATGTISGTPTVEQVASGLVVDVVDVGGTYRSQPFSISVIADTLAITSASNLRTRLASPFETALVASNATGATTWALAAGELPTGLAVEPASGKIAGTPTEVKTASGIVLEATDAIGLKGRSAPMTIAVIPQPEARAQPVYTLRRGVASAIKVEALNVLGQEDWQPSTQLITPGVTLDKQGRLVGTPTTLSVVNNIQATVTDTADGASGTSAPFSVKVEDYQEAFSITGVWDRYSVRVGKAISMTAPTAGPAAGSVNWRLATGALPQGLGVEVSTGKIVGIAASVGSATGLRMAATDGTSNAESNPFSVTVAPTLQASMPAVTKGKRGDAFSAAPTVVGQIGNLTWTISGGQLPPGLSFDSTSGRVSGVPTLAANYPYLIFTVTDSFDGASAQTPPVAIEIDPGLIVRGPSSLNGKSGVPFDTGSDFQVDGATQPLTWQLVSGTLPAGLNVNSALGSIAGTPTTEETQNNLQLQVTDAKGLVGRTKPFSIAITGGLRAIAAPLQIFQVNKAYGFTPKAENAVGNVVWSIDSGALPPGLAFSAGTGRISGVPTATGDWRGIKLRVTDSTTATALTIPFTIQVVSGVSLTLARDSTVTGRLGSAVNLPPPNVTGGIGKLTFDWAPAVPTQSGFVLNADTGAVTGTLPRDSWWWNLRVTDEAGSTDQKSYMVDSNPNVQNDGGGVGGGQKERSGQVGDYFEFYSGTQNKPYVFYHLGTLSFHVGSGTLPAWARLDPATGQISGTPDVVGVTVVDVIACDSYDGNCDGALHTITITDRRGPGGNTYLSGREWTEFRRPNVITVPAGFTQASASIHYPQYDTRIGLDNAKTGFAVGLPRPGFWKNFEVRHSKNDAGKTVTSSQFFDIDIAADLDIDNRYQTVCVRTGAPFEFPTPKVTGQRGNLTFAMTDYTKTPYQLPAGLSFDTATGILSGTPTAPWEMSGVRFSVTDDWDGDTFYYEQKVNIRAPLAMSIGPEVRSARVGDFVFQSLSITGWGSSGTKISVKSGSLPKGLSATYYAGYIYGTIEEAGVHSAVIEIEDTGCDNAKVEAVVNFNVTPRLYATSEEKVYARVGVTARTNPAPQAKYAGTPLTWSHYAGTMPNGMSVDQTTGQFVGKPVVSGTYNNLQVKAVDPTGSAQTNRFSLVVNPGPTIRLSSVRFDYHVQSVVGIYPSVTNVVGATSWSLTGTLPPGLSFDPATGSITGTAQAQANVNLSMSLIDSEGAVADPVAFQIVIDPVPVGKWNPYQAISCRNGDGRWACVQVYRCTTGYCADADPSGHICATDGATNGGPGVPMCYGVFSPVE
ncbi:Ig domain-containing protein [Bosea sp. RAC05]|uniref:Ig domain-containing protein n=1 Tax=Bosea sp. RAC05 TaxID=1842539 RepID=UPI00083CCDF6|nr:Ig domain-containing protein [Bosea sp. RAC05]AOG03375.1 putative Ig domain protein [Bosea sp. RAC05]